jgi:signal transduction histidine kinase
MRQLKHKPKNLFEYFLAQMQNHILTIVVLAVLLFAVSYLIINFFERSRQLEQIINLAGETSVEALNIGDWDIALKQVQSLAEVGDIFNVQVLLKDDVRLIGPIGNAKFGFGRICKAVEYSSGLSISGCKWLISRNDLIAIFLFIVVLFVASNISLKIIREKFNRSVEVISRSLDKIIRDDTGNLDKYDSEVANLTELTLVKNRIQELITNLAEAAKNDAIAKTVQNIAHDLKNPINVIELSIDNLKTTTLAEQKPYIVAALTRLRHMVEKFKKAETEGLVKQEWQIVDWNEFINEMQPIAEESDCFIHLLDTPRGQLHIDADKIHRSLLNLSRNAIEAGAKNIWLTSSSMGTDLAITVMDDGPGVPDSIVAALFQRGVTSNKEGGTGLGLNFVRETAEGHGGRVRYERDQERSIFSIYLPKVVRSNEQDSMKEIKLGISPLMDMSMKREGLHPDSEQTVTKTTPVIEYHKKVMVRLLDRDMEKKIYEAIAEKYPTVETTHKLEESAHVWTNDTVFLRECFANKVPAQLLLKNETFEDITRQVFQKLKYMV